MNKTNRLLVSFYRGRQGVIRALIFAFVLSVLHYNFHNEFNHHHDETCSVYVLEQLFHTTDVVVHVTQENLFVLYLFISYLLVVHCYEVCNGFHIRAPPSA